MEVNGIIRGIDEELARLQQVRALLAGKNGFSPPKKRHLSAEARERIAAAQRKRWAKQKRAAK
jgi:hypothetical protein